MSEVYRKTSAEELTAMADELRAIGPFEEDETFYFATEENLPEQNLGVTKLMPKYGSTTVLERDGICESWVIVDKEDYPYGVTKMRRPNYESYRDNTSETAAELTFYIYGLDSYISANDGLDNYIEVLNGYYTITYAYQSPLYIGTGTIITVYDEEDNAVEKFVVVLYGDLDSSGSITSSDQNIALNESGGRTWSSSMGRINYMVKAADLDQNGNFNNYDVQLFTDIVSYNDRYCNQIYGRAYLTTETKINTYYPNIIGKLSFTQAFQAAEMAFYQKIARGELTQEDVDDIIFNNTYYFRGPYYDQTSAKKFAEIKKIKITADVLRLHQGLMRCNEIEEIEIVNPEDITYIGYETLANCSSLKQVPCEDKITQIKQSGLRFCTGLTSLNVPNLQVLDKYSLVSCTNIHQLELPSITTLGEYVFQTVDNLSIYFPQIPPSVTLTTFKKNGGPQWLDSLTIYIPIAAENDYLGDTNWNEILNNITYHTY